MVLNAIFKFKINYITITMLTSTPWPLLFLIFKYYNYFYFLANWLNVVDDNGFFLPLF